jgi:hypothetical protein
MATVVITRFSKTFEGWRSKALTMTIGRTRENEETLQLPDFIKGFMSYYNFSLPNGLLPHGAEHITLACHGMQGAVPLKPLKN